jgi:hypothetical protein
MATFLVADITRRLPFPDAHFDTVMSNVAMHFFSEPYLRELLAGWRELDLTAVSIPDRKTGEPGKQVWRGIAHR